MSQIQSGDMNYCEKKGSEGGVKRGIPQVRDHIMAERKRREKLSQSFIALSALLPGLKKMDKASVLGDAIKYVKEMKEKLTMLEEQNKKRRVMESVVTVKKSPICGGDDDSSSSEENVINGVGEAESLPEVEVRVSDKDVLLRIHCQKHKGILVKILAEIQNLDLFVVNSSVLPFGDSNIDVTIIAQMGEGYNLRMKDLEAAGDCSFSLEEENKFDSNLCRDHNNNNDSYGSFCISSFNNPTCQVPVVDDMVKEEADLGSKQSESRINSKARERQRGEGNDHIIAERMRRKKITQHFIALSALIPGLKKVDKATVLEEAIKYVKELEEQVKVLEEKSKKESVELEVKDEFSLSAKEIATKLRLALFN
ncbi:transcription factor bHLH18-like [Senna tora]|uniref:Transcription factor bHLH18-like n=1 Tax=Senna tora TaxID=362788 RepID=A0A834SU39_9FABA|nr:transcription factor bHLH18-like [Senna tora]